ncbi:MAG: M14 family zinc carboxypeptidase [bacterium]
MRKILGRIRRGITGVRDTLFERVPLLPASTGLLGMSLENREIPYFRIGNGPRKILLVAAIHGNEVGTTKLARHLITWLGDHRDEYKKCTFFVVPCLNPDGQAVALRHPDFHNFGRRGRLNAHGVDLNRNFPTRSFQKTSAWTHGKDYQEKTAVYCGERGRSEPEIKALTLFITQQHIDYYFGFHSAGRDVMGNDNSKAQKLADIFSKASGYTLGTLEEWNQLGQTGTAKEWCDEQGIAYVEIEAAVRWGSDWKNQREGIEACLKALNA